VRRRAAAVLLVVAAAAAAYLFLLRDSTVTATVTVPAATSTIGSGSEAVAVSADGVIVPWLPVPSEPPPPELPISEPPKGGRLAGHLLEQARVLGAAPVALRPYLKSSHFGETGVDVDLTTGVELRFGDASQAARKWRAAAAVLADPTVTELDYVDLHAPGRPAVGGSGHQLPPAP
jgi:hypothetical protein